MAHLRHIKQGIENSRKNRCEDNSAASDVASQGINNPHTRPYAIMEFDPMNPRGKLPGIFAPRVGSFIGDSIILQDVNRNHIEVSIERKKESVYFTHGWARMRDFYGIGLGGWVTLLYSSPYIFKITVRQRTGIEVAYPKKDPPYRLMLTGPLEKGPSNGPVPFFAAPTKFAHKLHKTLTAYDIESGTLVLSWRGFCQYALPNEEGPLTIIDWMGNSWRNCYLRFENNAEMTCKLSEQWIDICNVHRLRSGVVVEFGARQSSNNRVLYFKVAPFLGVRTSLVTPCSGNNRKSYYQTEHYFML